MRKTQIPSSEQTMKLGGPEILMRGMSYLVLRVISRYGEEAAREASLICESRLLTSIRVRCAAYKTSKIPRADQLSWRPTFHTFSTTDNVKTSIVRSSRKAIGLAAHPSKAEQPRIYFRQTVFYAFFSTCRSRCLQSNY